MQEACNDQEHMGADMKIVSGGQTGVDRAALDAARAAGLAVGGWIPRGRMTEADPLDETYPLIETPSVRYSQRTEWNVRDTDGTLVLTRGIPEGGTAYTIEAARRLQRACLVLDLEQRPGPADVVAWLKANRVSVLNVAGPRESKQPGIYRQAYQFLEVVIRLLL